jgi:hypothetical protein
MNFTDTKIPEKPCRIKSPPESYGAHPELAGDNLTETKKSFVIQICQACENSSDYYGSKNMTVLHQSKFWSV